MFSQARFNGPCGKFKLTNMADDQVDLTPGDIPDARFSEKFWLKWSRINQTGNKKKLLERCISSGFARSISSLFSTTSLHRSSDRCSIQNLLSQGQEPASNENLKIYDLDPERIFTIWSKVSETDWRTKAKWGHYSNYSRCRLSSCRKKLVWFCVVLVWKRL